MVVLFLINLSIVFHSLQLRWLPNQQLFQSSPEHPRHDLHRPPTVSIDEYVRRMRDHSRLGCSLTFFADSNFVLHRAPPQLFHSQTHDERRRKARRREIIGVAAHH